jgi:hypothetical protein
MHRVLQVGPSLGQFASSDSPDDDATEPNLLLGLEIGDDVFNDDANIGESLERRRQILFGTIG